MSFVILAHFLKALFKKQLIKWNRPNVGRKLLLTRSSFKPNGEGAMECPKYQDLMDLERFFEFFGLLAWKCTNCGAVIDKTIASQSKQKFELKAY